MEKFSYKTPDGVTIHGIHNSPSSIAKTVICFHMMPATKESYIPLMQELEKVSWLAAAIDFRGHGESTENRTLDWHNFDEDEHQKYLIDAEALYEEMLKMGKIDALVGASIGANISLVMQAKYKIASSVLLSPGLEYHGIETIPSAKHLDYNQSCYIVAAEEKRSPQLPREAQILFNTLVTSQKQIDIYPEDLHGTNIINDYPDRINKVVTWLNENSQQQMKYQE
jgi:pimeloyl-ACP methyl ester carboxylesterase